MSKKQKKNLQQLIAKRQQLQQVSQSASPTSPSLPSQDGSIALPAPVSLPALNADNHIAKEVRRTVISFVFILLLLVVAVIIDRQTPYLSQFGDRLFHFLRLKS